MSLVASGMLGETMFWAEIDTRSCCDRESLLSMTPNRCGSVPLVDPHHLHIS